MLKTIDIYITKVCNLNCEYCYVDLEKKVRSFDNETFTERINLLEYDIIRFIWWEPLIQWNNIVEIVESTQAKKPKMQYIIVTNGTMLDTKKVSYIQDTWIIIENSLHFAALKRFFHKEYLEMIFPIRHLVRFSLIFEPNNIEWPTQLIEFLEKNGFYQFCLSPEVYGDWTNEHIAALKNILVRLIALTNRNKSLVFLGPDGATIPIKVRTCTKTIADEEGQTHACNRLERIPENFQYEDAFGYFDRVNGCDSCHNKWFCICPVSWYLDAQKDPVILNKKAKIFHQLNEVFIEFYKTIHRNRGNKNFLTGPYDNLRLNLTNQCNLRCDYCYLDFNNQELSFEIGSNIIEWHLRDSWDEKIISFFGGEPLLKFDNLMKFVAYVNSMESTLWKKITYCIATNATMMTEPIAKFLYDNNFDIHISWNGTKEIHNNTRDTSYVALKKWLDILDQYFLKESLVILLAFGPDQVSSLYRSFEHIFWLGYRKFNFELFYWEKYIWEERDLKMMHLQLALIFRQFGREFQCLNLHESNAIDISVDGEAASHSFGFHWYAVDFSPKGRLISSIKKLTLAVWKR